MSSPGPCIEFLRHGLPEGGSRYRGNGVDDPLSATGWQQMWNAMGEDTAWDRVISSPLRRCAEFAGQFAERHCLELEFLDDLREVGFGSWEGKTKQQLKTEDEAFFNAFYLDSVANRPPGAEDLDKFQRRVVGAFDHLDRRYPQQRLLVVAHAGVMRTLLMHSLDIPLARMYRINIGYAARLTFLPGEPLRVKLD